jgi:hypothetical protein
LLLKQQPLLTELLESSFSPAEHAARTCELGKKNQKHGTKKRDIRAVLTSKTNWNTLRHSSACWTVPNLSVYASLFAPFSTSWTPCKWTVKKGEKTHLSSMDHRQFCDWHGNSSEKEHLKKQSCRSDIATSGRRRERDAPLQIKLADVYKFCSAREIIADNNNAGDLKTLTLMLPACKAAALCA